MNIDCIVGSNVVAVDPAAAFAIFTGEIAAWRKPKRPVSEEPGKRLVVEWRQDGFAPGESTQVEVRFAEAPGGTRVTIERSARRHGHRTPYTPWIATTVTSSYRDPSLKWLTASTTASTSKRAGCPRFSRRHRSSRSSPKSSSDGLSASVTPSE